MPNMYGQQYVPPVYGDPSQMAMYGAMQMYDPNAAAAQQQSAG